MTKPSTIAKGLRQSKTRKYTQKNIFPTTRGRENFQLLQVSYTGIGRKVETQWTLQAIIYTTPTTLTNQVRGSKYTRTKFLYTWLITFANIANWKLCRIQNGCTYLSQIIITSPIQVYIFSDLNKQPVRKHYKIKPKVQRHFYHVYFTQQYNVQPEVKAYRNCTKLFCLKQLFPSVLLSIVNNNCSTKVNLNILTGIYAYRLNRRKLILKLFPLIYIVQIPLQEQEPYKTNLTIKLIIAQKSNTQHSHFDRITLLRSQTMSMSNVCEKLNSVYLCILLILKYIYFAQQHIGVL
eukprot:TRINITY_DN4650_c1_g2_i4.p2 TRINITY_DN4650_c1_g2~~TRINITY_DN4650_c1_g2_i4.p2  ORF type:complete len:293 (+),score=-27.29 TRINITY_DN4650_c1_g2_i4:470-1348(+)